METNIVQCIQIVYSIHMYFFFSLKTVIVAVVILAKCKLITEERGQLAARFQPTTIQTVFKNCNKVEIYLHTKYIKSRRDDLESTMVSILYLIIWHVLYR